MRRSILTAMICCMTTIAFAQDLKFGKITKDELAEQTHPLDPSAKAAYLYKHQNVYYVYDGNTGWSIITEVHERIKLYSKEAVEAATKTIRLFKKNSSKESVSSLKAYTYNLVGGKIKKDKLEKSQIFKEETSKYWNQEKFTMPNLQDGSIVEWSYKKKSPYVTDIDDIAFQHDIPINKLDLKVSIPEYFMFKKHYKGYLFTYFQESSKNRTINYSYREQDSDRSATTTKYNERVDLVENVLELTQENIPAMRNDEPYISNISNYIGGVKFELNMIKYPGSIPKYYTTSWEDVVKQIYKSSSFGGELSKEGYFKEDLQALLVNTKTNQAKIAAILQFVKTKVKWNGMYGVYTDVGVRKAYNEGVGNVAELNLILIAMLREAGLDANPVLVSTRNNDGGVLTVPTINGFNYVVAAVSLNKTYVVLDATESYSLPNVLPLRAVSWQGRIVGAEGVSNWLDLTPNRLSDQDNNLFVNIDSDFKAKGMLRTTFTDYEALGFRKSFNHLKEDGLITKFENDKLLEIDDFTIANKTDLGKPIVRTIKFTKDNIVEVIDGKTYLQPLMFLATTKNPFKLDDRKFPIDFGVPTGFKNSVSIKIPEGYAVESVPESVAFAISNDMAVFKYRLVHSGNKITLLTQLDINRAIITPEFYKELKELFSKMVKKENEKVVLIKQ